MHVIATVASEGKQAHDAQVDAEQKAMKELYERMETLPPQTQMFMEGCPPQWEQKRHRINCRDLVMRNLLALSVGVQKTFCWNLANEKADPYRLMNLMFDKFKIMEYEDGMVKKRYPAAETLSRLTRALEGVELVQRMELPERPTLYLFEAQRRKREPLLVAWEQRDVFSGEDEPPVPFEWSWPASQVTITDVFGQAVPAEVKNGRLYTTVSIDPIFIESHE